MTSMHYLVY